MLDAVPPDAKPADYASAIIEENCLGKQTIATAGFPFSDLRELYALDADRADLPHSAPALGNSIRREDPACPSRSPCP